jgi:LPXTG-site transpeptidase (sortase) family protein
MSDSTVHNPQVSLSTTKTPLVIHNKSRLWPVFNEITGRCLQFVMAGLTIILGWSIPRSPINNNQQLSFRQQNNLTLGWSDIFKLGPAILFALAFFGIMPLLASLVFASDPAVPAAPAPTRLVIPSINLNHTVIPLGWKEVEINGQIYAQWLADDKQIGWHNLTAPLGQAGNTVMNGHSDIYSQVFQDLDQVEVGDEIMAFSGDQFYLYRVAEKILVQEKGVSLEQRIANARLIMPTEDERLTLITCAYPGATHRLIVIAYPVRQ